MQRLELSHQQRRSWQARDRALGIPVTRLDIRVSGPVDPHRLETAIASVVDRHEVLRTRIELQAGLSLPVQVVYESAAALNDAKGPHEGAVSIRVTSDTPGCAAVVVTASALLLDRYSCELLLQELADSYATGQCANEPLQYADYAAWVDESMTSADTERGRAFWASRDSTAFGDFALAVQSRAPSPHALSKQTATLGPPAVRALAEYAEAHSVDIGTVVTAGWLLLLFRHGTIDTPALGLGKGLRTIADLQTGMGLYHQYLPLTADLNDDVTFIDLLARVAAELDAMNEWQDCFSWDLLPAGRVSRLRYLIDFVEPRIAPVESGLSYEVAYLECHPEPFDLKLVVEKCAGGDAIGMTLWFDDARVEPLQAARFLPQLELLLADAVKRDHQPVGRLEMTPADEASIVVRAFNDTRADYPLASMTLVSLFRDAVARFSDQRAVSFENESLTYGELDRVSNQIAHVLADRYGVRSERIVALMMERSIHLVPALYGVLKAGGAYLPLDPDHPDDRLRHILDEARVACVLCDRDQIARLQRFGVPAVCVADLDLSECSDEALQIAIDPAHPAYVIYTSGSTGLPKGVLNEHRGICNLLYWLQEKYQIGDGDRMLQKTPYTFDVSVPEFFWPLNVGAQLIVAKPGGHRDPGYLAAVIRQTGITTTSFVPTMLRLFLEHPDAAHCTTLKRVLCAGEPLVSDLKQRFQHQLPGTRLFNLYGPTETAVYVTEWDCAAESPYGVVPIGYPIANTQIRILDEALKPLPIGVKGELYIGGAQVARGYVNRDDLTRERFISDPFSRNGGRLYRSGDICRWLPDGSVAYIGRADSQIKLKGLRIELGEIEAVISSHVDVAQCVVVVRNVSDTDRRLVAYLVAAEGATLDTENVRTYVTAKVPDYMVPAHLEVLAELPTTSSGKVDRRALPAPVLSTATEYVEPRNDIERYLAQTWQRMLQVDFVGVHDSFFELGGDSLQAAIFCNALSSVTDCYVSVVAVFEHSTVEGFANWLREEYPTAVESLATGNIAELAHTGSVNIEPVPNRATTLPLTEYQARTWFIDALEERNPAYNTMIALELRGQVDISALRNAIRELVDRHEILRTRYHVNNGRLVQSVRAVSEAPFSVVPMDTPWSDELMERCIRKEARRTFDLAAGEIMHASLYCGSDGAHLLVVDVHQIASDAWCRELLAEEIAGLYSLQISGSAKPLGTPKLQYGDFVLWNLDRLAGSDGDDGRAFWSRFLQGRGHVLDLPVNKLRPPVKTNQGASLQRTIDASLLRRVAELSGREHVSGFMILLACFYVLLARYCKQTDIEVGSTVACRERKETHGLMGRIANMIAVPASIDPARTFSELLAQVRENLLAAYAHQDYPLTRVLQDVVPPRDLSLTPLYQVVFAGETRPRSEPVMPGIEVRAIAVDKGFAKYDMTVIVMEEGEALTVDLEYNEDVFVEASMRQLLEDYAVLLGKLVGNPALPIAAAELEPARDRLTHGTNRTWIDGFPVDLDRVREALLALEPIDGCELRMDFVAGRNALVARYTGTKSDPDRLRQMLAWHVPAYMLPAAFVHTIDLADLPASATALPAGSDGQIDEKADGLIAQIVEQWRDLLGQPTIGAAGSFFAVGGNSMLALAAAHRATRSFGVPVSLRNFFETGTPRALAAHIRALRAVLSPAVPAQGRQEVRL